MEDAQTIMMANRLSLLLEASDQLQLLASDTDLVGEPVEEILCLESLLHIGCRPAMCDTHLPSKFIPAGIYIHTSIASSNRVETVFNSVDISHRCKGPISDAINGYHLLVSTNS